MKEDPNGWFFSSMGSFMLFVFVSIMPFLTKEQTFLKKDVKIEETPWGLKVKAGNYDLDIKDVIGYTSLKGDFDAVIVTEYRNFWNCNTDTSIHVLK